MLTIEQVEELRKSKDLTLEEFSIRLGYSSRAYAEAVRRGKISRWMAKEIRMRFRVKGGDGEV